MNGCPYLEYDAYNGDYDCSLGKTIPCERCKHGQIPKGKPGKPVEVEIDLDELFKEGKK